MFCMFLLNIFVALFSYSVNSKVEMTRVLHKDNTFQLLGYLVLGIISSILNTTIIIYVRVISYSLSVVKTQIVSYYAVSVIS